MSTPDERNRLIMTPDERNRLIVENLPLVGYLASETHARATHVPREDLVSAGALALVTAADAFDPDLGVPFGAYARRRILGAFADEMRSMDWAPRGVRSRIKETTRVQDALSAALGRQASIAEIATTMGVSQGEVSSALADAARGWNAGKRIPARSDHHTAGAVDAQIGQSRGE